MSSLSKFKKTHFRITIPIKGCSRFIDCKAWKEEKKFLFYDALNTLYLRLYGVGHMVKDHTDSERGNPLPPHGLLFPINSKGSFICTRERERNVLFNDALNTFYLRLYGVRHMIKDHSDSEKGNPLPPHGLLFPITSKGSFICTIPQTGLHIP